ERGPGRTDRSSGAIRRTLLLPLQTDRWQGGDHGMSDGTAQGPGGSADFIGGIAAQFEAFRQSRPAARTFVVTIMLVNQETLKFDGLRIDRLQDYPGCVMIRGASAESNRAWVVRDNSIFKAEFQADPVPEPPFGF